MDNATTLVLMLCLFLLGALCYANGVARTEKEKREDGKPIEVIQQRTCFFRLEHS
jgi:hypothetical protein